MCRRPTLKISASVTSFSFVPGAALVHDRIEDVCVHVFDIADLRPVERIAEADQLAAVAR